MNWREQLEKAYEEGKIAKEEIQALEDRVKEIVDNARIPDTWC